MESSKRNAAIYLYGVLAAGKGVMWSVYLFFFLFILVHAVYIYAIIFLQYRPHVDTKPGIARTVTKAIQILCVILRDLSISASPSECRVWWGDEKSFLSWREHSAATLLTSSEWKVNN